MVYKKRTRKMKKKTFRKNKKRSVPRGLGMQIPQRCRIQETVEFNELEANTVQFGGFALAAFNRASNIAINFRWYRPVKVIWSYEPKFNTFQQGITGDTAPGTPYIYFVMNRTQDNHIYSLNDLQAQGAIPQKLVGKKVITYTPNWCSPGLLVNNTITVNQGTPPPAAVSNIAVTGLKAQYAFTQCPNFVPTASNAINPVAPAELPNLPGAGSGQVMTPNYAANVMFNGHDVYIEQDNPVTGATLVKITCTVIWEFKGAQNTDNNSVGAINVAQPVKNI